MNLQTPEEMLERWRGVECKCDRSVGHLCEGCHDTQVLRQLIQDRDQLRWELDQLRKLCGFDFEKGASDANY